MAGASGYVLKQIRGTDLVDAVRRVAAGQSLLDPAVTARVLERIAARRRAADRAGLADRAGTRILELIAEGLTNRQIGERMFLAEKTVKNYVSSLLAKLGLERRTQAAVFATKLLGSTPDCRRPSGTLVPSCRAVQPWRHPGTRVMRFGNRREETP